jgi:hypothetical protein
MRRLSLRHRLRSEQGLALPMALGTMLALTVSVTAVVQMSSSAARGATYDFTGQEAMHTAEAGFNQAASIVAMNPNNTSALPACPASEPPLDGVSWCGTKSGTKWTIRSTSRMANPTGPGGGAVSHTVEADFEVQTSTDLSAWQGVYTWSQNNEPFMQDGAEIYTPMHLKPGGNYPIEIKGTSRYMGEYFAVDGKLKILDTSSVGTSGDVVNNVLVTSGCNDVSPCGSGQRVYPGTFSTTVPTMTKPTIDFTYWRLNAKPGPATVGTGVGRWPNGCSWSSGSVPSFTSGTFNLMPSSSYECKVDTNGDGVLEGHLKWVAGTPGTLTVYGNIYAEGGFTLNRYGVVSGKAALYVGGNIMMQDEVNTALCGQADTTPGRPLCSSAWDPNTTSNILMIYSKSTSDDAVDIKNRFEFQGGIYTDGRFTLQNDAIFKGPLVSKSIQVKNQVDIQGFTTLTNPLPGVPGNSSVPSLKLVQGSWRS